MSYEGNHYAKSSKTCRFCGKAFIGQHASVYCSLECRRAWQNQQERIRNRAWYEVEPSKPMTQAEREAEKEWNKGYAERQKLRTLVKLGKIEVSKYGK